MTVVSPFIAYPPGFQPAAHFSGRDPLVPASPSGEGASAGADVRAGVSIRECLIHDGPNCGSAAPALGTAAQTSVDLGGAARAIRAWVEARAHISV